MTPCGVISDFPVLDTEELDSPVTYTPGGAGLPGNIHTGGAGLPGNIHTGGCWTPR